MDGAPARIAQFLRGAIAEIFTEANESIEKIKRKHVRKGNIVRMTEEKT
jgi:hypothetical protein